MQAMNAQEAREMLKASQQKPNLVTQVVPSPITFTWDATIQGIVQDGKLGDLIYVEVHQQTYAHTWTCIITGNHSNGKQVNVLLQQQQQQPASSGSVSIDQHCEAPMTRGADSAGEGPVWRISASYRQHDDLEAGCGPEWSKCHEAWDFLRGPTKVSSAWMPCVTQVLESFEMRLGASRCSALCCWPCPHVISRYAWRWHMSVKKGCDAFGLSQQIQGNSQKSKSCTA